MVTAKILLNDKRIYQVSTYTYLGDNISIEYFNNEYETK